MTTAQIRNIDEATYVYVQAYTAGDADLMLAALMFVAEFFGISYSRASKALASL